MSCLMGALVTDLWVHTTEPVTVPVGYAALSNRGPQTSVSNLAMGHMRRDFAVDFRIGLWKVCPHLLNGSSLAGEEYPSISCTHIRYLDWSWSDINYRTLGLWSTVDCTTNFVSRMRLSTLFTILSVAILGSASLLTFLSHCVRGTKMLLASGLYALGGLVLGCALIIFVCVLSEEFSSQPQPQGMSNFHPNRAPQTPILSPHYYYGWSFILAVLAFLGSEISAVLCFSAFLNRFDSEEEFVKSLPGMERKINEHLHGLNNGSVAPCDQGHNAPLLKGSFGHHVSCSNHGGPIQHESPYDLEIHDDNNHHHHHHHHHHQLGQQQFLQQRQQHQDQQNHSYPMVSSPSVSSVIGLTRTSHSHPSTIPVTAEITSRGAMSPSIQQTFQNGLPFMNGGMNGGRSPPLSSPQRPRSHFSHSSSSTLPAQSTFSNGRPRSAHFMTTDNGLANGINGTNGGPEDLATTPIIPPPPMSEYGFTPDLSPLSNPTSPQSLGQMTQISRSMLVVKHNGDITSVNGNAIMGTLIGRNGGRGTGEGGGGGGGGGGEREGVPSSPSRLALATATMPRNFNALATNNVKRKKSVTIGTFTTVEAFDSHHHHHLPSTSVV